MSTPTADRVADVTARRLLARVGRWQVEGRLPSMVAGVVRDGALVWSGGYGDVPGEVADTQYKIGSITKTFTAVLVLQLVEEGALSLDDPVSSVLGPLGYGDRTVRSLLAHNAGLQAEPNGPWWERSAGGSFADLAAANDGSGAALDAGEQFHYTNLGYGILGEVIARLRGATWWESVESRILAPLGMGRTSYQYSGVHAQGMSVHPFSGEVIDEPHPDTGAMAPAGQMWSTVGDLATYCRFLIDGHPDVLPKEALERAYVPQSGSLVGGLDSQHALGFQLFRGGSGMLVGHTGSMPGFVATCFVDLKRRTGVVAFANATAGMPAGAVAVGLLEELEASEPTLPRAWKPSVSVPEEVRDALGLWHWRTSVITIAWEGDALVTRRDGVEAYRHQVRDGRIVGTSGYMHGEELKIVRNDDGTVNHLDLATFILTRTPYDPAAPIPGGHPQ